MVVCDGSTKMFQLKDLIPTLFGLIIRRIYTNIYLGANILPQYINVWEFLIMKYQ
jgi:hypothetical protein